MHACIRMLHTCINTFIRTCIHAPEAWDHPASPSTLYHKETYYSVKRDLPWDPPSPSTLYHKETYEHYKETY